MFRLTVVDVSSQFRLTVVDVSSHCRPYSCVVMGVQFVAIKFRKFQNHGGESLSWHYRPHSSSVVSLSPLVASRSYHIRHCRLLYLDFIFIVFLLSRLRRISYHFRLIFVSLSHCIRSTVVSLSYLIRLLSSHYFQGLTNCSPHDNARIRATMRRN